MQPGTISMPVGTSHELLFPLVYADPNQGPFDAVLTTAHFYVGKRPGAPPPDLVLQVSKGAGIAEKTIGGVRYLSVMLTPDKTVGLVAADYHYAVAIEWDGGRAVLGPDFFILKPWPGQPVAP